VQWDLALFPAESGAAFTEEEEAFFRAGEETLALIESFDDLDADYRPRSFWEEMLGRRPPRAATEPPIAPTRSSGSIVVDDDEEWEWQIAIARARAAAE
jgi:hypothetical protein